LSIIMEGYYDLAVLGAFISLPQYRERFGDYYPDIDQWQIPAEWQVGFALGPSLGNWIGIPLGALIIDKLGYRKTLIIFYFTVIPLIGKSNPLLKLTKLTVSDTDIRNQ
jgi:SP family general alpha glucoside:H+ symporter-like MFS transporter